MKVRLILLLCLFSSGLLARVPESSVVIAPIRAVRVAPSGTVTIENLGPNIERGMRSILESRGTQVRSLAQNPSVAGVLDVDGIANLARTSGADMVYVTDVKIMESEAPFGELTASFCADSNQNVQALGKIVLSIRAFSSGGKLLWTSDSNEPYRCAEPTVEIWSQMMTALEKAPL